MDTQHQKIDPNKKTAKPTSRVKNVLQGLHGFYAVDQHLKDVSWIFGVDT